MTSLPVTLEELYLLIGEREVIRYKQQEKIKELLIQADEMSKTIEELRAERLLSRGAHIGNDGPENGTSSEVNQSDAALPNRDTRQPGVSVSEASKWSTLHERGAE